MLDYEFMRNAFAATAIVAVLAGCVGWFLVLRGQSFAGHALAHIGFTGATGAVLVGLPPLWGMVAITLLGGAGMGLAGERLAERDVAIGIVLALALGFGLLFLHFFTASASQATALLFGNVLGVSRATLRLMLALAAASLAGLAAISRPLLFASLQPELARARGVRVRVVGTLFLGLVALAVAEAAQVVGVLLVFTLMVGPAAAAQRFAVRVGSGMALAVVLALVQGCGGLALAWWTDWPASFWITVLSSCGYALAVTAGRLVSGGDAGGAHALDLDRGEGRPESAG